MKGIKQIYDTSIGKGVVLASIPFLELNGRAIFTQKTASSNDDYVQGNKEGKEAFYQRELNQKHLTEIKKYIQESLSDSTCKTALFPTSMLIAATIEDETIKPDENNILDFDLPDHFFIVDGQHRLAAMEALYEEVKEPTCEVDKNIKKRIEEYQFNCSILINYDLWEQSIIFADVNFKQKKVNKSLYYDIYGAQYQENGQDLKSNYIYVAHTIVKFLNQNPNSPLCGEIKMLGNGKGLLSQAFLVEALIQNFKPLGIWYFDSSTNMSTYSFRPISNELVTYLTTLKELFKKSWPENHIHQSRLLKTSGFGALLRLLPDIHKKLDEKELGSLNETPENRVCTPYKTGIEKHLSKLSDYEDDLFSFDSTFRGGSGKGDETKLYKTMKKIIFDTDD